MIQEFKFGFFKIDGKTHYDDLKIINGKVKQWSDRNRHDLTMDNLQDIITTKPELIIIGIGASGLLKVSDELKQSLQMKHISVIVEKTPQACESYNKAILEKVNVAAILHATC